ncbi:class I SAM-dependent rRNA methyltransferase [Candidatus Nitrospira inopinata]|jgi:23S rRNA (cytosine1962-C5)-methyltransferase|uniref:Putative Methyltransferase with PUA domain n=1 Tax=Candidatus Nitrospira inopinata TaxID=1715989 RepID=A0A0S4KV28_9BACT|nr:class I SAM-dependent rRNA methyltransferase [Candidatus Nitrospira inopinata]CUQ67168.1 putative Methyltransferase with PUA domain [Candidatus Nitrospira inopinata]
MAIGSDAVTARITLNRQWARHEPGHLWVYAGHVGHVEGRAAPGDLVEVIRPDGRRHGIGFFNPASKIMVRLLTFEDERIDEAFWRSRIDQAIRLRQRVVNGTNAYRLIFSEGDRLPGLIVDRYDHVLVMQTLSYGMDRRKDVLADILMQATGVSAVYLRNDAKSRRLEGLPLERRFLLGGGPTEIEIKEGRARFLVDIERGQKTGWFCDQRGNRLAAATLAEGGEVLDVFCHTGAFGIHAALAGARSVEGLDVGEEALALARRHTVMNQMESRCLYRKVDAFEEMRNLVKADRRYDLVMLDPPAFARSKEAIPRALAGYKDVNLLGIKLLKPEGFLVTSSCSQPVSEEALWGAIRSAARDVGRQIRLIESRGQGLDHPVLAAMPETRYLKCFIAQIF